MNLAHYHLLLNHFPTIGFGVGLVLFFAALYGRSAELKRASYVVFFVVAVLAIPTYVTGNIAEEEICPPSECGAGISRAVIRGHEDAALLAFSVMELTGFAACLGLWQLRRTSRLPNWNVAAVVVLSLVTFGLMARAANKGGEIRHPEIQAVPQAVGPEEAPGEGAARSLGSIVNGSTGIGWVWPAFETLHFVGLCLLFTCVLLVNLRILGMAKSISYAGFYQLLPLGMLGFGLNLVTGMMFFVATPSQYTRNPLFYWKILFVVLAGINALYFMLFDEPWDVGPGEDAPMRAKLIAVSAIFLWIAVLYCGHMLPFKGNSF